ncbi:MAG: xylose isomerase [Isosphaeraceae bacterium]|jgi:sugar phosphate isomerase/epimerase|nr:MAG: xylose isomerase [Isosphaeraceae bacterium]
MRPSRRQVLLGTIGCGLVGTPAGPDPRPGPALKRPIGVSTYSFWQFRGERLGIEPCIELAAEMGFDGVEILHVQMTDESSRALNRLKARAHGLGLCLMGFSTHQGFVYPEESQRRDNVQKTLYQIELAARLGIPTMRINTGRWNTTKSFDQLMADKGIEPPLPGVGEDQAFDWVIGSIEKLLPRAEELGVVLGLENHWGLGRTAAGVLRIVEHFRSPWLQMTLDTGNFLESPYEQMEAMAASPVGLALVQAKTYQGGGRWYTLELDYQRIGDLLDRYGYRGWISLEFEGNADPLTAVPESLALLRQTVGTVQIKD